MFNYDTYVGIDPGLSGAVCIMQKRDPPIITPMPIKKSKVNGKIKKKYCIHGLIYLFSSFDPENTFVTMEHVSTGGAGFTHQQGTRQLFNTGRGSGLLEMVLACKELPHNIIAASKWQKHILEIVKDGSTKERSLKKAKELYPDVSLIPPKGRVESDGFSDALLICEYGKRDCEMEKGMALYK